MPRAAIFHNAFGCIPKLLGADLEFGNSLLGIQHGGSTAVQAAQLVLQEIDGLPASRHLWSHHVQDWSRKFLPANGASPYIDLFHVETALPECLSARDHVALVHAMLRIVGEAQRRVNARLPEGQRVWIAAHNSDGQGQSFGAHANFLLKRETWDILFHRRVHYLNFLASFQVCAILITGQGKVGCENGGTPCDYQIAQRADFFERLTSEITTEKRGIVNCRDEALCGDLDGEAARLHCIFFDFALCHSSIFLKAGAMQVVLAMIEAGLVNPALQLEDPVAALHAWSRDPLLNGTPAMLLSGERVTAVELLRRFWQQAARFVERGGCDGVVIGADAILEHWDRILTRLEARDFAALARHLDWVLKLSMLGALLGRHPELNWSSPEIKHLDHLYGSLDGGLYFAHETDGRVERLVAEKRIEHFTRNPPEDTRAWTRAMLLRRVDGNRSDALDKVDWDHISFRLPDARGFERTAVVNMPNPLGHTKAETAGIFARHADLESLLAALGAERDDGVPRWHTPTSHDGSHWKAPYASQPNTEENQPCRNAKDTIPNTRSDVKADSPTLKDSPRPPVRARIS